MSDNIGYSQTEMFLKNYRKFIALLQTWKLKFDEDLIKINSNPDGTFTEDEILYTRFIGNHLLSNMPHGAPIPGNKVINAILFKDKIAEESEGKKVEVTLKPLVESINTIGKVLERLEIARGSLSDQEKSIIEKFYYQQMSWKAILKAENYYIEEKQAKNIRSDAIKKMVLLLQDPKDPITMKQFDYCIEQLKWYEKKEG